MSCASPPPSEEPLPCPIPSVEVDLALPETPEVVKDFMWELIKTCRANEVLIQ